MSVTKKVKYIPEYNRKKTALNKEQTALIQIRIYQEGKQRFLSTGIYIKPDQWDNKNKIIKNNTPNYIYLNQQINSVLNVKKKRVKF
ncbi:MAG: hypothetical protein KA792_07440 [Bacteroidales bacterium]|nr:hypothetical protein [Bacteroidales bacterium]